MINIEFLKNLRKTSQRTLARDAGISFASVQRAEKGKAGLNVLKALARHFKVPIASLLKENGE